MLSKFLTIIFIATLAACAVQEPVIQTGAEAEVIMDNLHRVDGSRVAMGYVNPDINFSKYEAFIIDELNLDDVEIIQPSSEFGARKSEWVLEAKDKAMLAKLYKSAIEKEFTRGDYPLVTKSGPNVLRISSFITRLAPTAPKDNFASRPGGRGAYLTEGAGSVHIAVLFHDTETGKVVAALRDGKEGSNTWRLNNRMNNTSDVRRMFSSWARQLTARLDIIHGANFGTGK